MGIAKVISVDVKPFQAADLCFETDGIVGESTTELGAVADAFDFATFYGLLRKSPTISGQPSRLLYDASKMEAIVKPRSLASLRAETIKAALSKAINARQNAYFAKYGHVPSIISRMKSANSPGFPPSKPNRLHNLSVLAQNQADELEKAYQSDGRAGVVKTTNSYLVSSIQSGGSSSETGTSDQRGVDLFTDPKTFLAPPGGGSAPSFTVTGSGPVHEDFQMVANSMGSVSTGFARESQTIVNTDYGYRIPYIESQAENERAQISLIDRQFDQFMSTLNLDNLTEVFQNELSSIDSDVLRLQIGFLDTMLMSPFAGVVTEIYKNPGEAVRAGEPVVRVENDAVVLLHARVRYRGAIFVGSSVTVGTMLFDAPGPPTAVTGNVVAVRGRDEDDEWEVVVKCDNLDGAAKPIFPLGYSCDYDDTTVTII